MFEEWIALPYVPFALAVAYALVLMQLFPLIDSAQSELVRTLNVFITQAVIAGVLFWGNADTAFTLGNPYVQLAAYIALVWFMVASLSGRRA